MNNVNPVLASANQALANTNSTQTETPKSTKESNTPVPNQSSTVTLSTPVRDSKVDYTELDPRKTVNAKLQVENEAVKGQDNTDSGERALSE